MFCAFICFVFLPYVLPLCAVLCAVLCEQCRCSFLSGLRPLSGQSVVHDAQQLPLRLWVMLRYMRLRHHTAAIVMMAYVMSSCMVMMGMALVGLELHGYG